MDKNSLFLDKNNKAILSKNFFQQSQEVIFRSFAEVIKLIGKKHYFVRGKKLDRVISNIYNEGFFKETLGGCIIKKANQTIIISKER